ncbi:MAG: hypothetical protein E6767_15410 [Dysgonomonas sp.]|nr:hypothetical protein [Dysgonomonas sp.]
MNLDKISDERLFQNNTKEDIKRWCQNLRYFHYMRDRGGHNCEGDSFCAYFKYDSKDDLITKLKQLGVRLNSLEEGDIAYDPFESYSFDDLDKLKIVITQFKELEQPQYVSLFGHKAHIWIMNGRFEISVSGTKDGKTYKVSDNDFTVCLELEKEFDKLNWKSILDDEIKQQTHCISKEKYPELYS